MDRKRIAVLGAGPIGLEAALQAARLGHDVVVYERDRVGGSVRRWGHVRLFSPWSMDTSPLGREELSRIGCAVPGGDACPTGNQWVAEYLEPLAVTPALEGSIRTGTRVVQVGRSGLLKSDPIGEARAGHAFVLLLEDASGRFRDTADIVLDCTGCYDTPNHLGDGGVPAVGEESLGSALDSHLDALSAARLSGLRGRRVLLVGDGLSAATAAVALDEACASRVHWVARVDAPPYAPADDDPLTTRAALQSTANELAGGTDRFTFHPRTVIHRFDVRADGIHTELGRRGESKIEIVVVDHVLGLTGYRPDSSIHEELQIHQCYASEGPMALAATLLGGSQDCLEQSSAGPETLLNPEPGYHIVGAKSYGRNSSFLYRTGLEQVRDLFAWMESRSPERDASETGATPRAGRET